MRVSLEWLGVSTYRLVVDELGRVDIQVFRPSDRHFGRQIPQIGTKSPILHKLSQMWLSAPL